MIDAGDLADVVDVVGHHREGRLRRGMRLAIFRDSRSQLLRLGRVLFLQTREHRVLLGILGAGDRSDEARHERHHDDPAVSGQLLQDGVGDVARVTADSPCR